MAAGIVAAVVVAGCGLFEPEHPVLANTSSGVRASYVRPDTTLATIALAIAAKAASNGQSVYVEAFADTSSEPRGFHAFFDPATLARYTNPETNWDLILEAAFYVRFCQLQPSAEYVMVWAPDPGAPDDDIQESTALLHRKYDVFATQGETASPIAKGFAELEFLKVGTRWKIVRWQDREDPTADINLGERCFGQRRQESRGQ